MVFWYGFNLIRILYFFLLCISYRCIIFQHLFFDVWFFVGGLIFIILRFIEFGMRVARFYLFLFYIILNYHRNVLVYNLFFGIFIISRNVSFLFGVFVPALYFFAFYPTFLFFFFKKVQLFG